MTVQVTLCALYAVLGALFCRKFLLTARSEKAVKLVPVVLLFGGALLLRLILGAYTVGYETDINTFKAWAGMVDSMGMNNIYYSDVFLDYPPGYLYILWLLEKLRQLMGLETMGNGFTLLIKLPSIFADIACGWLLYRLTEKKTGSTNGLILAGLYLFCPAVLINSTVWGQADSFCVLLLLGAMLLLLRGDLRWIAAAGALYGLGILMKPQMLLFAPVFLFFVLKKKDWKGLGLGLVSAFAVIFLLALPYTRDFDFTWLFEQYADTMGYYNYFTINAYNLYGLLGLNWYSMDSLPGWVPTVLTAASALLAVGLSALLYWKSQHEGAIFAVPFVIMATIYLFAPKMHERYLFPALFFLLLCAGRTGDRRLYAGFLTLSALHFLNVSYVLYLNNSYISPTSPVILVLSALHLILYGYLLYILWDVFVRSHVEGPEPAAYEPPRHAVTELLPSPQQRRMSKRDWLLAGAVTVVYAFVGFWCLGSHVMPVTSWEPAVGESVTLSLSEEGGTLRYLPGLTVPVKGESAHVGTNLLVETSEEGTAWTEAGSLAEEDSVFAWHSFSLPAGTRYIRLTAVDGTPVLNEVAVTSTDGQRLLSLSVSEGSGEALLDEQEDVPLNPSWYDSTYFDEIYHARTAYEHLLGAEPYENTHPTLGKLIMSLGIVMFGMNPFGCRFLGALLGVLMLPILYHLIKRLLGKSWLAFCGTLLFALDFMHFTQTRIATIDTYAVFFLLLMYDTMLCFCQQELRTAPMRKLLLPLLFCGIFTGLGIASKWTAAYGAVGLAVLFFWRLFRAWRDCPSAERAALSQRTLHLILWCCLFFLLIPFGIYYAAFLPVLLLPGHDAGLAGWWGYQIHMYNYHSGLQAEHSFSSNWYQWPVMARPVWYHITYDYAGVSGQICTISGFGNPVLWWGSIPALLYTAWQGFVRRRRQAGFILVGFLSAYLPWVLVPRLTFLYHYFTALPFALLALLFVFDRWQQSYQNGRRIKTGKWNISLPQKAMAGVLGAALILFIVFFPVISGAATTADYAHSLQWLPGWFFCG